MHPREPLHRLRDEADLNKVEIDQLAMRASQRLAHPITKAQPAQGPPQALHERALSNDVPAAVRPADTAA